MTKKFKYSHLYSTSSTTSPNVNNMVAGEIALGLKTGEEKLWASDGTKVIDLGAAIAKTSSQKIVSVTPSPSETNVKEEWKLVNADGSDITGSEHIKIYKDSSLLSVALLHATDTEKPDYSGGTWTDIPVSAQTEANRALCFAYELADGSVSVEAVNVGAFINEQEFASGVTWDTTANKVRGVVDSTSEGDSQDTPVPFLTVGAGGFKIDGIKDEIDRKIQALDASVSGGTTAGTATSGHIQVVVDEVDGKLTGLTVTEADIASASALTAETAARKAVDGQSGDSYAANTTANYISGATSLNDADVKLDAAVKTVEDGVGEINDKLGTGVTTANTATDQLEALSGTTGDTSASTSVIGAKIYAADYTNSKISALDASVTGGTTAGTVTSDHVQVVVDEADGKLTAVTVNEANIADASALSALNAKTVTEIGSSNSSITASSSVKTDGTVEYDIQTDASKIKLTGYTSGATDLFAITSANTVTEAFQEIEGKLYKDNTNIVFSDDAPDGIVYLSAGTF